jgi:DnaJ-class molecular chaperone
MDIFKLANQIANNMSMDEKTDLDGMDMQDMISHVTKNVFSMMNNQQPGQANPFAALNEATMSMFTQQPGIQQNVPQQPVQVENVENTETETEDESNYIFPKTRDICFDLNVDLEDFYTGKRKKLNVKRKRMVEVDGKQTVIEEKKKLVIPIEKGMKDEQQIRFEGEADQIPGYKPGDIIVTLIENEHPIFQRDSDNLIMIKNINLYQSYDFTFDIKHLDNNVYRISNVPDEGLHVNDSIRKISSLGMPSYKSQGTFGDLFIRFNLVIPKSLSEHQLELLKTIFKDDPLFEENKLGETFNKKLLLENVSDADLEDLEDLEDLYSDSEEETESDSETESESDSETESESESDSESDSESEFVCRKKMSLKHR